ncbi:MAG: hypothetical protein A2W91_12915 [Bacteroidetes bacterium GWF2_38_335]|nr:MAG: hypothetical protein A2W91_12915 [Bacteroidetes bacterium GWF2_38_335]HBS86926.1 hypothetical protein [Bacteroidales bacterium]
MSTQKSLIKLEGNMGGISFYYSDGKFLARMANGPTKDRIEKDPAFKRTRENNMEFGGAAKAAKSFRRALSGILQSMADSRLTARLTKLFKMINLKGAGKRGQRIIELTANRDILANFNLNKDLSFTSVFPVPYTVTNNVDRNEATVEIPNFVPGDLIKAPAGATHFKMVAALGVVSDYSFNASTKEYEALKPALDGISAVEHGAATALDSAGCTFTLTVALPGTPAMNNKVSVVLCLGIEFYQIVDSQYYLFAQDNAMMVVSVF